MSKSEAQMFSEMLVRRVDQIINSLDGLTPDEINQRPPVPEANSLSVLAVHTMANVEENVFEILGGQPVGRVREQEFLAEGTSAEEIRSQWEALRSRVVEFLEGVTPEMMDREYEHARRGRVLGREVLLVATAHAAEHAGHAELTKDWLLAQRS